MKIDHGKNASAIQRLDDKRRSVPTGFVRYRDFREVSSRLRVRRVRKMITDPNSKDLISRFQEECKKTKILSFRRTSKIRSNEANRQHNDDAA